MSWHEVQKTISDIVCGTQSSIFGYVDPLGGATEVLPSPPPQHSTAHDRMQGLEALKEPIGKGVRRLPIRPQDVSGP